MADINEYRMADHHQPTDNRIHASDSDEEHTEVELDYLSEALAYQLQLQNLGQDNPQAFQELLQQFQQQQQQQQQAQQQQQNNQPQHINGNIGFLQRLVHYGFGSKSVSPLHLHLAFV